MANLGWTVKTDYLLCRCGASQRYTTEGDPLHLFLHEIHAEGCPREVLRDVKHDLGEIKSKGPGNPGETRIMGE